MILILETTSNETLFSLLNILSMNSLKSVDSCVESKDDNFLIKNESNVY